MSLQRTRRGCRIKKGLFVALLSGYLGNFGEPLLRTMDAPSPGLIPTSVDFVSTEPSQLLTAFTSSTASIIDIETGATILSFDFGDGWFFEASSFPYMCVPYFGMWRIGRGRRSGLEERPQ